MKKVITLGEVMMRLSTPRNARFTQTDALEVTYGGGEANVTAALAWWGIPAAHVTCFPDNDLGHAAAAFYRRVGVDTGHIVFRGQRLGLYFLEVGAMMRPSKVIYDRSASAFAQLDPADFDWDKIFEGAGWFHFTGITPAVSEPAARLCQLAVTAAKSRGLTVSADVNSRKNLWQWGRKAGEVMTELAAGCDVLVCGSGDAEELFGIKAKKTDQESKFANMSRQIMERFPHVKKVIGTKRESLTASHNTLQGRAYTDGQYLETPILDMDGMVDRIGGGDAFMAGYIYGQLTGLPEAEALHFATAASALKHSIEGDINLVSVPEVQEIVSGNVSGKLSR